MTDADSVIAGRRGEGERGERDEMRRSALQAAEAQVRGAAAADRRLRLGEHAPVNSSQASHEHSRMTASSMLPLSWLRSAAPIA